MGGCESAPAADEIVRIQVLDEAENDLQDGREFYDRQESGVNLCSNDPAHSINGITSKR